MKKVRNRRTGSIEPKNIILALIQSTVTGLNMPVDANNHRLEADKDNGEII